MKKTRWLVLAVFILASAMLLTLSAGAAGNGSLELTDADGTVGETVTVDLVISNNPGLLTVKVAISYDEDLELVAVEDLKQIAGYVTPSPTITSPYTLFWKDSLSTKNNTECGAIARLTFKIKDDAELGEKKISVKLTESRDANGAMNTFDSAEATVNVIEKKSAIKCAQIAIGTDISMNYYADILAADTGAQMRFIMHGKETLTDGYFDEKCGLYVFPFTGVTPQAMGDNIKAELILGDKVLDTKDNYSVLQNCKNLLGKSAAELGISAEKYAAMQTLIADLMEYGAAAQVYCAYKTDCLVNRDEVIQTLTPTEFVKWEGEDADFMAAELTDSTDESTYICAAGVYFDYINSLYIKFVRPGLTKSNFCVIFGVIDNEGDVIDKVTYTLEDDEHPIIALEDDEYLVVFDPVPAYELSYSYEMDDVMWYDITINKVEIVSKKKRITAIQDLIYSIPTYVCSKQDDDTPMSALAKAVYNYGLSAAAYQNAK